MAIPKWSFTSLICTLELDARGYDLVGIQIFVAKKKKKVVFCLVGSIGCCHLKCHYYKIRGLNWHLFTLTCGEMESFTPASCLDSGTRWLSWGCIMACLFELNMKSESDFFWPKEKKSWFGWLGWQWIVALLIRQDGHMLSFAQASCPGIISSPPSSYVVDNFHALSLNG